MGLIKTKRRGSLADSTLMHLQLMHTYRLVPDKLNCQPIYEEERAIHILITFMNPSEHVFFDACSTLTQHAARSLIGCLFHVS